MGWQAGPGGFGQPGEYGKGNGGRISYHSVWIAGYFFWQNSQFWRYMRYFLPIYPFIVLFAAWALWELFDLTQESRAKLRRMDGNFAHRLADFRQVWKSAAAWLALGIVLVGTYGYALAIYPHLHETDHPRGGFALDAGKYTRTAQLDR